MEKNSSSIQPPWVTTFIVPPNITVGRYMLYAASFFFKFIYFIFGRVVSLLLHAGFL